MVAINRTTQEKADLIARYVGRNPNKPGIYNAILIPYGVSVWIIVSRFETVNNGDIDLAAADYNIPREAVEAALAYYEQHKAAIDEKIEVVHA